MLGEAWRGDRRPRGQRDLPGTAARLLADHAIRVGVGAAESRRLQTFPVPTSPSVICAWGPRTAAVCCDFNQLRKLDGRNIILEEYDSQNKLVGTFDLTFATEDPQKHFKTKEPLHREVLVGIWNGATGKESYPVYLIQIDSVDGSEDGGRCDLNGQEYQQLQEKISNFYTAVVNNDPTTLEKDFSFVMPHPPIRKTADWRKVVAETVPHDLFCNWKGYMLGDGIVWFDSDGNVITLH